MSHRYDRLMLVLASFVLASICTGQERNTSDADRRRVIKEWNLSPDKDGKVKRIDCRVHYVESGSGHWIYPNIRNRHMEGLKYVSEVESIALFDTWVTDAGLVYLRNLPRLRELRLGTIHAERKTIPITDEGMAEIAKLKSLKVLQLTDMRITDEGIAKLKPLTQLESLYLSHTLITDEGLTTLAGFTNLQELVFWGNEDVSNVGMAQLLASLKKLHTLRIGPVISGGALIKQIGKQKQLEKLNLWREPLRDADLIHLSRLENLQELNLYGTEITDEGVTVLQSLKKLRHLDLHSTKVTERGAKRLNKALPKAEILYPR